MARKNTGLEVPPLSISDICNYANKAREAFSIDNLYPINMLDVLENKLYDFGFIFEVSEDLGNKEGQTFPDQGIISLRDDVYDNLCNNGGRARFTAAHEIGHLALHRNLSLNRAQWNDRQPIFKDSEWQADTFASFFLMPTQEVLTVSKLEPEIAIKKLMDNCGVSYSAAKKRLDIFIKRKI